MYQKGLKTLNAESLLLFSGEYSETQLNLAWKFIENQSSDTVVFYLFIEQSYTICFGDSVQMFPMVFGPDEVLLRLHYYWLYQSDTISRLRNPYLKAANATTEYHLIVEDKQSGFTRSIAIAINTMDVPAATMIINQEVCQSHKGLKVKILSDEGFSFIDWKLLPSDAGVFRPAANPKEVSVDLQNNHLAITFQARLTTFNGCVSSIERTEQLIIRPNFSSNYIKQKAESNLLYCKAQNNAKYSWGYSQKESDQVVQVVTDVAKNYNWYSVLDTNRYKYWVTVQEGLCADTYFFKDFENSSYSNEDIVFGPNPFSELLSIDLSMFHCHKVFLKVVSIHNHVVYTDQISCHNQLQLSTSNWPSGIYILEVFDSDISVRMLVKKILKI